MRLTKVPRGLFLLLAVALGHAAGARPPAARQAQAAPTFLRASLAAEQADEEAVRRAGELLALSERQNYENHALALQTARQALALWQTTGDRAGTARAFAHVASCHQAQGDLPEAAENYEAALQLWRDLNDTREQAGVLILLGYVEANKGEWANAINFFTQAEALVVEADEPQRMGQIAAGLAYVFNENGLPKAGLEHNHRTLDYFRLTPSLYDDAMGLVEVGISHYLLKDYPAALSHLQQALATFPPGDINTALCYHYLGKTYTATGEHDAALQHLEVALSMHARAGNRREEAEARALIGQVYQQQGRLEPARQSFARALATFEKLSDRINQAAVYYALGTLELGRRNYDAAEDYLRRSVSVTEDIRRVSASSDLTAAFSATVYERYEKYVECLMRRHEEQPTRGYDALAFETSELARARSLSELLRATQTNLLPGLDPELAAREKTLRQSLRVKEDRRIALLAGADKKGEVAELEASMAALDAEYREVVKGIRASHPAFERLVRPAAWDLRRIQQQVVADDQTVLLEYSLGSERSHVWVVTRDGFESHELPARQRIEEAARKVYYSLSAPPGAAGQDELVQATRELSRMVLAPVAAELNRRRVLVVADGVLNYVPFQVLPSRSDNDEPLVAGHEIVNAPSASILGELREEAARRRPAAKTLAAFGDPVFESDFAQRKDVDGGVQQGAAPSLAVARLRQASRDIELDGDAYDPASIQSLFYAKRELANLRAMAGADTFVAEEFDANRARLLGTDLTGYAILHFATHGLLDPQRPELSGLLLSTVDRDGHTQDGFVGLQDVYGLRTPVNLVVLSACRTGLGKDVRGEGLLSLTRGFMYAGASGVVASLWNVNDEATSELMKQFYANMLREGMPPAAALREAQNSIRQRPDRPEWRSPYYWAAFTLQGESRPVARPARAPSAASPYLKLAAGVVLLTLLAGVVWWYGHRGRRRAAVK